MAEQLWDYYFSAKQSEDAKERGHKALEVWNGEEWILYTEGIRYGKTPRSNYDDLELVCSISAESCLRNIRQVPKAKMEDSFQVKGGRP